MAKADIKRKKTKRPRPTKINWPTNEELLSMVNETNFSEAGRKLGVSDNAVRKRLRKTKLI